MSPPPTPAAPEVERWTEEYTRVLPEPWRFHVQVAATKLLPVTVRVEATGRCPGWFGAADRRDVAVVLRKYVKRRVERVWSAGLGTVTALPTKAGKGGGGAAAAAQQVRRCVTDSFTVRRKGAEAMRLRAAFRPVPEKASILQASYSAAVTNSFSLQHYTTTPNELLVTVDSGGGGGSVGRDRD